MAKENIGKMKREPSLWENIFTNDSLDKSVISKIYKELNTTPLQEIKQPN